MVNYDKLLYWIKERQSVYLKKEADLTQPWTTDPVLSNYRFCNVYREQDAVTKWIAKNIRENFNTYEDLWFLLVVSRLLNLPDSIGKIIDTFQTNSWDKESFRFILKASRSDGNNIFNAAYIVSTNGLSMDKVDYITDLVLSPLWERRGYYRPTGKDSLQSFYGRLNEANGMGKFMSAQVVADMKYCNPLMFSEDWWSFAEPGPGSLRGMRYLIGLDVKDTSQDKNWKINLDILRVSVNRDITPGMKELCAQNLQNCLCEFSKFMKTILGEGKPKQQYRRAL